MQSILGTMTFGRQVDQSTAATMIDSFLAAGYGHLDTAHIYCRGETEKMLGEVIAPRQRAKIYLATKAHPWDGQDLSAEHIRRQLGTSLVRLNTGCVDLFYLHSPDAGTPIVDTLRACWGLHQSGKFKQFGLSNYAAWQVADIVHLCERNGWMKPVAYQGMYNALTRDVERELLPCLKSFGIRFYAYNPLAGGLLSGKYAAGDIGEGRFKLQPAYRDRFWDKPYFDAVSGVSSACDKYDIAPGAAALRWLVHHSRMSADDGDAVVLGASKVEHLTQNMEAMKQGPLADDVVAAFDQGWETTRPVCSRYFRP